MSDGATPLWAQGIAPTARAVREGRVTPVEVLGAVLGRIDEIEPEIRAYVDIDREHAFETAERLTAEAREGRGRGPLHGVPIAVKDNFDAVGMSTRLGSALFGSSPPAREDADAVGALRSAGAIVLGKTAMHELACGVYTPGTRNPRDSSLCCGGSSGGSAAAVASGMAMGALGSDTGCSVRVPASVCGVVGLKPTYDLISRQGVVALSESLDHVGLLGATVEDVQLLLEAVTGDQLGDPTSASHHLHSLRVGVPSDEIFARVDPVVGDRYTSALQALVDAGSTLVPIQIPGSADVLHLQFSIAMFEAARSFASQVAEHPEQIGVGVRRALEAGARISVDEYRAAQRARSSLTANLHTVWKSENLSLVCTPTAPIPAYAETDTVFRLGATSEPLHDAVVRMNAPFNLTGFPALSLPMGLHDGRPMGLQVVAKPYEEAFLLRVSDLVEMVLMMQ